MKRSWKKYMGTIITVCLISGCAKNLSSETNIYTDNESETSSSLSTETITNLPTTSEIEIDTNFTARDLEVGYEDTTATKITLSESGIEVSGEGATVEENVLTISDEGVYVVTGNLTDGQIKVEADDSAKIQIVLDGANITCTNHAPIYIKSADKVFITLKEGSENSLTDGSKYIQIDDNTVDGVIFSKADLTLNGSGRLTINGNYKHGILSKDDLVVTGGTYDITAVKDALNGKECVKIKDGIFSLSVTEGNGIQSKNDKDTTKGFVYIAGGQINITSCEEGIEGTAILITDGIIDIIARNDGLNAASGTSTTEGIVDDAAMEFARGGERKNSEFRERPENGEVPEIGEIPENRETPENREMPENGEISENTLDQGNEMKRGMGGGPSGAFDNDENCYIVISGGTITIDASGDGIDSNGSIYISGGSVYVSGPASSGDGGLDYGGSAEISGGIVVVASSAGMAQSFSDTSTQYSIMYTFSEIKEAGAEIKLADEDGNIMVSYIPNKQYQTVVISTPNLEERTYTLTSGEEVEEIRISDIVTNSVNR